MSKQEKQLIRMKELVELLNKASKAYYQESTEIMSNYEYDKLYDELLVLEQQTGTRLENSPSINVGYEVLSDLPKEKHLSKMLSLDKTKDVDDLANFIGDKEGILSWKLDGLTVVLTYENGELQKAVTRGNGEIGEVITANAKFFHGVPKTISYQGRLVIRGEAIITYSGFEKINAEIENVDDKYKNPRNLASGTVRQLNTRITAKRNVHFMAFQLVEDGDLNINSYSDRLEYLRGLGFTPVFYKLVTKDTMKEAVTWFSEQIESNDFPSDGLVLAFDDIAYGASLGTTSKFPRYAKAFKWKDEIAKTTLTEIEWSASRTGLLNPVAIFEPVELEGTTVRRASVHNVSTIESLQLQIGDEIECYKANMIIPQIASNLTRSLKNIEDVLPDACPCCGSKPQVHESSDGIKTLHCENDDCPAKHIKGFEQFVSRDAMNIVGLSESTLEKLVDNGLLKTFADIYTLEETQAALAKDSPYKIVNWDGMGEKSYDNLIAAINKSKEVDLPRFLYALGIPNVGLSNAKLIVSAFDGDFTRIRVASKEDLLAIDGIGPVIADTFVDYFTDVKRNQVVDALLSALTFKELEKADTTSKINGMTFVITGSVEQFANRNALKAYIESLGGKVSGSVSAKTNYLINNDVLSTSGKNKKAKELGIPIISEDDFKALI